MPVYQCPITGSYAPISHLDIEKLDWEIEKLKSENKRLKSLIKQKDRKILALKLLNYFFKAKE